MEENPPTEAPDETSRVEESHLPAQRPGSEVSAGRRLQATLAAADAAAEEILAAARAEAREHVARVERTAIQRTDRMQQEVEQLLARATELNQQAQALGQATRELTSSLLSELVLEAEDVTEVVGEMSEAVAQEPELEAPDSERSSPIEPPEDGGEPQDQPSVDLPQEPRIFAGDAEGPDRADAAADLGPAVDERETGSRPPPAGTTAAPEHAGAAAPKAADLEPARRRSFFSRLRRSREPAVDATGADVPPAARLLAAQMLVSGLDKEEVERRLRERFGLSDPSAVTETLLSRPGIRAQIDRGADT